MVVFCSKEYRCYGIIGKCEGGIMTAKAVARSNGCMLATMVVSLQQMLCACANDGIPVRKVVALR